MNYEIVTLAERIVKGIVIKTTNEGGKSVQDIGMLWKRFFQEGTMQQLTDRKNEKLIGLYTDYEGDHTKPYQFLVGAEVTNKSEQNSLVCKVIPAGKYAKFSVKGDMVTAVGAAWQEIWSLPLPRKYTADFEEYQMDSEDLTKQTIDIYIALQ